MSSMTPEQVWSHVDSAEQHIAALQARIKELEAVAETLRNDVLEFMLQAVEAESEMVVAEARLATVTAERDAAREALAKIAREQSAPTATAAADRFQAIANAALTPPASDGEEQP